MFPALAALDQVPVHRGGEVTAPPSAETVLESIAGIPAALRRLVQDPQRGRLRGKDDSPEGRLAAELASGIFPDGVRSALTQALVWLGRDQPIEVLRGVSEALTARNTTDATSALNRLLPQAPVGGGEAPGGILDLRTRSGVLAVAGMLSLLPTIDPPTGELIVRRIVNRLPDCGACPDVGLPFASDLYTGRASGTPLLRGILFEGGTLLRFLERSRAFDPYRTNESAAGMAARAFFRAASWTVSHPYFDRSRARRDPNPYFGIERVCSGFLGSAGDFRGAPAAIASLITDRDRRQPRRGRDAATMSQVGAMAEEIWFLAPTIGMLAEVGNRSVRPWARELFSLLDRRFAESPLPVAQNRPDVAPFMADRLEDDNQHPSLCLAPGLRSDLPPADALDSLPADVIDQALYLITRATFGYAWTRLGELEFHSGWPRGLNFSCWDSDLVNRLSVLEEQFPISRVRLRDFDDVWYWQQRRRLWEVIVNGPRVKEVVVSHSDQIGQSEGWFRRIQVERFLGFINDICAESDRRLTIWLPGAPAVDQFQTRWRRLDVRSGSPEPWTTFAPSTSV